ncbi:MAG: peptidoglycan DD-metalloendopeptidase family protein [Flavobacteriales bacterium]|nr:peptidoglycan DD-metalloendopeptidase family protein [Flavobacteriales bacterium]MCC6939238.1 peptidoglycan DD-metalloendopeptidase family protein [Flavobacteriales bacterium]
MQRWMKWTMAGVIAAGAVYVLIGVDVQPREEYVAEPITVDSVAIPLPAPSAYGIPMEGFVLREGSVKSGSTFGDLLGGNGVPMTAVHALVDRAKGLFDVRKLRSGFPYAFIFPEQGTIPAYFIYESDPVEYVVFDLRDDSLSVSVGHRPVEIRRSEIACAVTGALYNDLSTAGADPVLAVLLSEIFAWTVDFYRIQKGDVFSVVYDERTVDGERVGVPKIVAARYTNDGVDKTAFRFGEGRDAGYFDDSGDNLRKAFLKAPLKFSRVSSGFTQRRLHPVQKVFKAHLGTDYAAPYGTPILSVGDGVVEVAGRTGGNGNFVKIRHNGTYTTQYLHMRKILARQGQRVKQGDVIGEVGSTGLATGPHVCFRFWKNGVQVDPRREVFPSADPVPADQQVAFDQVRDSLTVKLDEAEAAIHHRKLAHF